MRFGLNNAKLAAVTFCFLVSYPQSCSLFVSNISLIVSYNTEEENSDIQLVLDDLFVGCVLGELSEHLSFLLKNISAFSAVSVVWLSFMVL